ncbi:MAG: carbamoyltransferase [Thermoanaerobaculia bacterium]
MTRILGLSAFFHDSAACLVVDGEIVAAAQEERFSRRKHDAGFPVAASRYCLREAGVAVEELDYVGFYEKPLLKFDRLLETYLDFAPRGFPSFLKALPGWMKEKLWLPDVVRQGLAEVEGLDDERDRKRRAKELRFPVLFGDHHESHAASAFYPSPFEEAAILTADGVGEWATSSIGAGRGAKLELLDETRFPSSLGLLYSAFTYYTGFRVNSGEYKVMGLAPYGEPRYVEEIRRILEIADDGSIRLDQRYFDYCSGLRMTNRRFHDLFGGPPRRPESRVTQKEMDLARSIQVITEEVVAAMARYAHERTGLRRLCLAGGVALNCVANGRLLRDGPFDDLWIQPAAGDAGGALGVALAIWHRYLDQPRRSAEGGGRWVSRRATARGTNSGLPPWADGMNGSYLGPRDSEPEIDRFLVGRGLPHESLSRSQLSTRVAELLAAGKVVGFHQGRMEFGPRALGARSILGDPRSPAMQSVMNLKIKFRESFRPFAPCVLREAVADWFELEGESPYMLLVAPVAERRRVPVPPGTDGLEGIEKLKVPRSEIPAVTHVDGSARIQTVRDEIQPELAGVLREFHRLTGCPVLVNTSFNVRGEPIVCTPEDSYRCFMRTEIDALALETRLLLKTDQPPFAEAGDWRSDFALD